ncbi:MAG: hypothetical protein ABI680_08850 [Chthoniobacteraceae bacterium]
MAERSGKKALVAELTQSRAQIAGCLAGLRSDLAVGKKVRATVNRNRLAWFSGAAIFGLLLSKIPARRSKLQVKTSPLITKKQESAGKAALLIAGLKFVLDLAKPSLMKWARALLADRIRGRRDPFPR